MYNMQITLMFDGLREGHEPHRHLATQAAIAFLETGSPHLITAVPGLVKPLRLAMQTYEPHLVAHACNMLCRLIKSHPKVGPALRPHFKRFLPYLGLFRPRCMTVHLPPPFCLPPCGSFTGRGDAPEAGGRSCGVCGAPVDRTYDAAMKAKETLAARAANAHLMDKDVKTGEAKHPLKGRWSKK